MGLKVEKTTGHRRWLPVLETFRVEVVHRNRLEQEQFNARVRNLGDDDAAAKCAAYFIADADGLTVSIARKLGIPVADDQAVGEGGFIECDNSTLADVWRHAYPRQFSDPLIAFSVDMLAAIELEKTNAKND